MEESGGGNKKKVVMVAIDESEFSLYALEWALQNLRDMITSNSHQLLIITAQAIEFSYLYASSFGATPVELIRSVQENNKRVAEALLERAKEICTKYGVAAETLTQVGDPKDVICEAIEKLNVQLLVLGSHGRKALQRAFLGSVSNYCVHNAKCPVLVVKKNG